MSANVEREMRSINEILIQKNDEIRVLWFSVLLFPLITSFCSVVLSVYLSSALFGLKMLPIQ